MQARRPQADQWVLTLISLVSHGVISLSVGAPLASERLTRQLVRCSCASPRVVSCAGSCQNEGGAFALNHYGLIVVEF